MELRERLDRMAREAVDDDIGNRITFSQKELMVTRNAGGLPSGIGRKAAA